MKKVISLLFLILLGSVGGPMAGTLLNTGAVVSMPIKVLVMLQPNANMGAFVLAKISQAGRVGTCMGYANGLTALYPSATLTCDVPIDVSKPIDLLVFGWGTDRFTNLTIAGLADIKNTSVTYRPANPPSPAMIYTSTYLTLK